MAEQSYFTQKPLKQYAHMALEVGHAELLLWARSTTLKSGKSSTF